MRLGILRERRAKETQEKEEEEGGGSCVDRLIGQRKLFH